MPRPSDHAPRLPNVYAHADVGRAGLASMLLPWARCEIFRHEHNVPMLAPRWTQPKIGPWLRGEKDKRYYLGLFNNAGYIRGPRAWMIHLTARKITEQEFSPERCQASGKTMVIFRGDQPLFGPILGHRELIARRLMEILSAKVRRRLAEQPADFVIAAHVRRGDKPTIGYGQPQTGANQTMPDEWFMRCIENIRGVLGYPAPVRVFSDAWPEQLQKVLALPNVSLSPQQPAIVDILTMARSRILICTAHSMFSMWPTYLGRMPSLWYPGGAPGINKDLANYESETDLEGGLGAECEEVIRRVVSGDR
jgi:hypothetical protein